MTTHDIPRLLGIGGGLVTAIGVTAQTLPNPPDNLTWWLLTGGALLLLGKAVDVVIAAKTKWAHADDGTDRKRYVECQEARVADRELIARKDAVIAGLIGQIDVKDKQIASVNDQNTKLADTNATWVDRYTALSQGVSQTNRQLAKGMVAAPPGGPVPVEVKIDPHGEAIPVREVGHGDDTGSDPDIAASPKGAPRA